MIPTKADMFVKWDRKYLGGSAGEGHICELNFDVTSMGYWLCQGRAHTLPRS